MRKTILLSILAILLIGGIAFYVVNRPEPVDTRYSGAYRLDDGGVVMIIPRDGKALRYKTMNGETGALWPSEAGADHFEGGIGWAEREPVANRIEFQRDAQGRLAGFTWQQALVGANAVTRTATLVPVREEIVTFSSGELTLRGKLVMPAEGGSFPAIVPVHGSEDYSAVDHYSDPYMHAAHGMASLVYDKRGTGGSDGHYTANFEVLSDDAIAAVRYLRTRQEIDATKIHLAGYSQGGWIAPLAALKDGGIRSVLVGFGVAVPVLGEDRWGYVYALQQKGFGDQEIAELDRISAILGDIFDRDQDRWDDFAQAVDASRDQPWFETAKNSDSLFGMILGEDQPLWIARIYMWWKFGRGDVPFIDRLYEPVQTLVKLDTPSLWIFGGQDSSAPTPWSVEELRKLQTAGKPIEYFIYPDVEHGITRFQQQPDGERITLGYEADYFPRQIEWFRQQSAL